MVYMFVIAANILNKDRERMEMGVTLTLNAKEMVCYDIKNVGSEVGKNEPFDTETRYYIKAVNELEASSDVYSYYTTTPYRPYKLGEQFTKYSITAKVPSTPEIHTNVYKSFEVHYYDKTQEEAYREKAIQKTEEFIDEAIKIEKFKHNLIAVLIALIIITVMWLL